MASATPREKVPEMNRIARTGITATALAVLTVGVAGSAQAQRPNEPSTGRKATTVSSCSAHPYTYACWQGPRRPDGSPAYRIVTGISPL
jgi:hypothetical protein